jgi:hypothetical protein
MIAKDRDAAWWAENFPTVRARAEADKAVDALDPKLPMTAFVDAWIAAYKAAGGQRGKSNRP